MANSVTIEVTDRPLEPERWRAHVSAPDLGAVVVFSGVSRNHHKGRDVTHLYYEAYAPMAERELRTIADGLLAEFAIERCAIAHRTGDVPVGESSLVVAVGAAHRAPAFAAAAMCVDRIKRTVPIWKKEFFADGTTTWVGVHEELAAHAGTGTATAPDSR